MNEKHSLNNSRKMESEPETVPAEPVPHDKLSRLLKDAISNGSDFFTNLLRDEFDATPEDIDCFLNYARKHSGENTKLDAYNLIRARVLLDIATDTVKYASPNAPDYPEVTAKLMDYIESLQKYEKMLEARQNAIHAISQAIDLISDPAVKEAVSQKCDNLIDVHEEITFLRYTMEELRVKVEKEKQKLSIATLGDPDDPLLDDIAKLLKNAVSQEEKLDRLHELSKALIIRQEEIKGELLPGGIKFLKTQAASLPEAQLSHMIKALTKSGITDEMWKLFWMNQEGMNNYDIAERIGVNQSTVYRKMEELKTRLHKIGLADSLKKYGTTKKQAVDSLDRSGVGEYSRKASRMEEDNDDDLQ